MESSVEQLSTNHFGEEFLFFALVCELRHVFQIISSVMIDYDNRDFFIVA